MSQLQARGGLLDKMSVDPEHARLRGPRKESARAREIDCWAEKRDGTDARMKYSKRNKRPTI